MGESSVVEKYVRVVQDSGEMCSSSDRWAQGEITSDIHSESLPVRSDDRQTDRWTLLCADGT